MKTLPLRPNLRQRGLAALEFALVFPAMFLVLYGLLTFGAAFYTQLAVSRAVEDGARAVPFLPATAALEDNSDIKDEVIESLASSTIVPAADNTSTASRKAWLTLNVRDNIEITEGACTADPEATCVTVMLEFPYGNADGTRLLPSITLPSIGDTESWMPDTLTSRATVRIES